MNTAYIILIILFLGTISSFMVFLWKLNQLHDLVNSRLSELLKMTATASHAAGMEQERQEEQARQHETEDQ